MSSSVQEMWKSEPCVQQMFLYSDVVRSRSSEIGADTTGNHSRRDFSAGSGKRALDEDSDTETSPNKLVTVSNENDDVSVNINDKDDNVDDDNVDDENVEDDNDDDNDNEKSNDDSDNEPDKLVIVINDLPETPLPSSPDLGDKTSSQSVPDPSCEDTAEDITDIIPESSRPSDHTTALPNCVHPSPTPGKSSEDEGGPAKLQETHRSRSRHGKSQGNNVRHSSPSVTQPDPTPGRLTREKAKKSNQNKKL